MNLESLSPLKQLHSIFPPYKNLFSAPRIHLKAQKIALNFQRNVVLSAKYHLECLE